MINGSELASIVTPVGTPFKVSDGRYVYDSITHQSRRPDVVAPLFPASGVGRPDRQHRLDQRRLASSWGRHRARAARIRRSRPRSTSTP
ncbi:hypothetical protein ACRAWD_01015 [Caulobacter segnis]